MAAGGVGPGAGSRGACCWGAGIGAGADTGSGIAPRGTQAAAIGTSRIRKLRSTAAYFGWPVFAAGAGAVPLPGAAGEGAAAVLLPAAGAAPVPP